MPDKPSALTAINGGAYPRQASIPAGFAADPGSFVSAGVNNLCGRLAVEGRPEDAALVGALWHEIGRLRIDVKELRASREAWSERAMSVQQQLSEHLCSVAAEAIRRANGH